MKIGIIGLGVVGTTIYNVMEKYNDLYTYDIKYNDSTICDIINNNVDIIFICVPTNSGNNGECDLTNVTSSLDLLSMYNYNGIICIKSTIIPETTDKYIKYYNNDKICFCPEFLKARSSDDDFKNSNICIVGTHNKLVYDKIVECHINDSIKINKFVCVSPLEAELTKYFQNVYNTYRILFANTFYEICQHKNIDYSSIINNLK